MLSSLVQGRCGALTQRSTILALNLAPSIRLQAATQVVPPPQLALIEGQLTWLVYIVGAIVKGRLSSSSAESQVRGTRSGWKEGGIGTP